MASNSLSWQRQQTPDALHRALETLSAHYPLVENGDGPALRFLFQTDQPSLSCEYTDAAGFLITCSDLPSALRGIGHALAQQSCEETPTFKTLGIMLDCSRNAVMTVPYVQRWLRQLALLGYNFLMLYTEDTYELPGEPYFGYMRGGYTAKEVREIDDYASSLGIEVAACIQTLGHLHQILKWPCYKPVMDTPGVLMVDEEKSYQLIEKMVRFWEENLRSRRIHVGMDEAHDMGRGHYLNQKGYKNQFDIFQSHLNRVNEICLKQGLKALIWSDMYFRMSNPQHNYYDRESTIPDYVKETIPDTVDLVYWDYYSKDESFYREWIQRHRQLGHQPIMASGLWTWARFWYDHNTTKASAEPCIAACRKENVSELFFTMWGDGGSYCEFDSTFAGLAWSADLAYGGKGSKESVAPMLQAVCGSDFATLLLGSQLQLQATEGIPEMGPMTILWDDPLLGIGWQSAQSQDDAIWRHALKSWQTLQTSLKTLAPSDGKTDLKYLSDVVNAIVAKTGFQLQLSRAYDAGDRKTLAELSDRDIPLIMELLRNLSESFRRQWLRRNKPFGMEVIQLRFGAMTARWEETARRLSEYLEGSITSIPELDARQKNLPPNPVKYFYWLATGSSVI